MNSPHNGQSRGALMFSLICAWTNGSVNNHDGGDFRRHYDVTVMPSFSLAIPMRDLQTMVAVNLAIDSTAFLLCLVGFFALTATMVAVGNHWDAVYTVTGDVSTARFRYKTVNILVHTETEASLQAPSHHLSHCWLTDNWIIRNNNNNNNNNNNWIKMQTFSLWKISLKIPTLKWRP